MPTDWIGPSGHLTHDDAELFTPALQQAYPLDQTPCFTEVVRDLDSAQDKARRESDGKETLH